MTPITFEVSDKSWATILALREKLGLTADAVLEEAISRMAAQEQRRSVVPVEQLGDEGQTLARFPSLYAAAKAMDVGANTILNATKNRHKAAGFYWREAGQDNLPFQPAKSKRPVLQLTEAGEGVKHFDSVNAAALALCVTPRAIHNAAQNGTRVKGYRWQYV